MNGAANTVPGGAIYDKRLKCLNKNLVEKGKNRSTRCADLNSPELTKGGEV
jgi:hypothetical protein